MERNMHRMEQNSRLECIEISGIPSSITNDLLEEHVLLTFEKLSVVLEAMDIVSCHRLRKTTRVIVVPAGFTKQPFTNRNVLLDNNKLLLQKLQVLNKNEK